MSLLYDIALNSVAGIGHKMSKQLIAYLGSAEEVLKAPAGKLIKVPGVAEKTIAAIRGANQLKQAESIINTCIRLNISILIRNSELYPRRLRTTDDAPALLYTKGNIECLQSVFSLAVVGTRKATHYGINVTEQLVDGLKTYPCLIVSGLAYGIDAAAHKAALQAGLPTVAVIGTGPDTVYPAAHTKLAHSILEQGGAWVSEYPPLSKPEAYHFPERNRIIAALSDVTVVTEAAAKGGALITATLANDYHREVMAVPGPVDAPYSAGCNNLIKHHKAHLCTAAQDIIELMNWDIDAGGKKGSTTGTKAPLLPDDLTAEEKKIAELLIAQGPMHIDIITRSSDVPAGVLAGILLNLEFSGIIKVLPGKMFCINHLIHKGQQTLF